MPKAAHYRRSNATTIPCLLQRLARNNCSPDRSPSQQKAKRPVRRLAQVLDSIGRGGGIRTRDPLHPMQVRYQAALRPDKRRIITENPGNQRRSISITCCNSARRPPEEAASPEASTAPRESPWTATASLASPSSSRLRAPLIVKPWL